MVMCCGQKWELSIPFTQLPNLLNLIFRFICLSNDLNDHHWPAKTRSAVDFDKDTC